MLSVSIPDDQLPLCHRVLEKKDGMVINRSLKGRKEREMKQRKRKKGKQNKTAFPENKLL